MRPLQQRRRRPRASSIRPAERYLAAGADLARRLGRGYIGTEHVLSVLVQDRDGATARLLATLGVRAAAVEQALSCWLPDTAVPTKIDPHALASLGIELETVRERLEQTFGRGALERTRSGCLGICPRLKLALAYALDHSAAEPLRDDHVLRGMLDVPDSVAARVLGDLGVSAEALQALSGQRGR